MKFKICFLYILILLLNCASFDDIYHNRSNIEICILKKLPNPILMKIVKSNRPNINGMVNRNRKNWVHVGFQRDSMINLIHAIINRDQKEADYTWRVVEKAFEYQTVDGNYIIGSYEGKTPSTYDDMSGVSFWLASLSHALLVVQKSDLANYFDNSIDVIIPKISLSADWLLKRKNKLRSYDAETANRLLFDGLAFGLTGVLLKRIDLIETAKEFVDNALKMQNGKGFFLEKGGYDTGYQSISLYNLMVFNLYFPENSYKISIIRGMDWLMDKIDENGGIDVSGNTRTGLGQEKFLGKVKDVNYKETAMALMYYAEIMNDDKVLQKAWLVFYNKLKG